MILACIEGFGPRPDLVVSGINHGINAGRSALHSGTVGAALTGAQFGIRGLAVSIAWGQDPDPVGTPVRLASGIVPVLAAQPPATVLNLNVPAVATGRPPGTPARPAGHGRAHPLGPSRAHPGPGGGPALDTTAGAITLTLRGAGSPADRAAELAELDPESDAALLAEGWATVTPLLGVREDRSDRGWEASEAALSTYAPAVSPQ